MRSRSIFLALSAGLSILVVSSPGQAQQTDQSEHVYPEVLVKTFVDACTAGGGKTNDPETMKSVCTCSIEGIQEQYTLKEFTTLSTDLDAGKPMPETLRQLVQACAALLKNGGLNKTK